MKINLVKNTFMINNRNHQKSKLYLSIHQQK